MGQYQKFKQLPPTGIFIFLALSIALLPACQIQFQEIQPTITLTARPSSTYTPTQLPTSSRTPTPSPTPSPTPTPTATSTPTSTPTPIPTPTAFGGYKSGSLVAYVANNVVMTNKPDGSQPVKLSDTVLGNSVPSLLGWSPDGQWVMFTEAHYCAILECTTHLWAARSDGSETRLIYTNHTDSHQLNWRSDGTSFIFPCAQTNEYNKDFCLGKYSDFSIAPTNLQGWNPQYSPDGKNLAWVQDDTEKLNYSTLYVLQDLQVEPMAVSTYRNWIPEFTWLPDNHSLIYVERKNSSTCSIYRVNLSDLQSLKLIELDRCYQGLVFLGEPSPNGNYLFYYYQARSYVLDIKRPPKSVQVRSLHDPRLHWSPDGQLFGLASGQEAVIIDPKTGETSKPEPGTPWLDISHWAPRNFNFYYEIFLQP